MSKIFDNLELTSSNIKLLYIEHIIKLHQRKPIVTDTRSKKISNTLQVNEADSFGIKPTPHWKYNKVSSKGKNSLQPNLPSHLPINRIKFRVFILFQILIKTNKRVPRQKTPRVKIIYIYIPSTLLRVEENISLGKKYSCIKP